MYDIYQIKLNDTIESLANRYGTTIEELRRLNPNSSFGVGSNIIVPTTKEYFEVYTIEKGDNFYPNNTILVPKKDVKYYFTKKDDTIASVNKLLNANINKLLRENNNIYLSEGQLIVYKD